MATLRIIFRQVDIGAYEFTPTNLVCCPVDIHTNWVIESSEAEQAVAAWKAGLLWNGAELAMDAMTRGYYIVQTGSNYIDNGQSGATRWITAVSASTSSGGRSPHGFFRNECAAVAAAPGQRA